MLWFDVNIIMNCLFQRIELFLFYLALNNLKSFARNS